MKYFIRSSVFGNQVLTDVNSTGKKLKTYVRANGTVLAWQAVDHSTSTPTESIRFEHTDASGMTRLMTTKTGEGAPFSEESDADAPMQLDPMGGSIGLQNAYPDDTLLPETESCLLCDSSGIPLMTNDDTPRARDGSRMKFSLDGISISWSMASSILESKGGMFGRISRIAAANQVIGWRVKTKWDNGGAGIRVLEDNSVPSEPISPRITSIVATPIYANISWNIVFLISFRGEQQQDKSLGKPPTVLGASTKQQDRFNRIWSEAEKRLQNKNCAKLFGGFKNAAKLLKTAVFTIPSIGEASYPYNDSGYGTDAIAAPYPPDGDYSGMVQLNARGKFFSENGAIITGAGKVFERTTFLGFGKEGAFEEFAVPSVYQAAALILLHELAHLAGTIALADGGDASLVTLNNQATNNEKVLKACFSDVKKIDRRPFKLGN